MDMPFYQILITVDYEPGIMTHPTFLEMCCRCMMLKLLIAVNETKHDGPVKLAEDHSLILC